MFIIDKFRLLSLKFSCDRSAFRKVLGNTIVKTSPTPAPKYIHMLNFQKLLKIFFHMSSQYNFLIKSLRMPFIRCSPLPLLTSLTLYCIVNHKCHRCNECVSAHTNTNVIDLHHLYLFIKHA